MPPLVSIDNFVEVVFLSLKFEQPTGRVSVTFYQSGLRTYCHL